MSEAAKGMAALLAEAAGKKRAAGRRPAPGPDPQVFALLQQGMRLHLAGEIWRAQECYRQVLERDPEQPDALQAIGAIAMNTGQIKAAVGCFRRALVRKPDDPTLRRQLGAAFLRNGDTEAAARQLTRSLKLRPGDPDTLAALAGCHVRAGRLDDARAIYRTLLEQNPRNGSALLGYANLLVEIGDLEEAAKTYRTAIEHDLNTEAAYAGLAQCETFRGDPPELTAIKDYLARPGLRPDVYVRLTRAASKIANDVGRYDEAFELAVAAGQYSGSEYDAALQKRRFDGLKRLFTRDFLAARQRLGDPSRKPVFVVGMPRSGTTLTERIIASHPQAAGAGELNSLTQIAASAGYLSDDEKAFARTLNGWREKDVRAAAREYLEVLNRFGPGAKRVVDKMPHNFQHLGLIALLFPNAKIIHCRRSPLDTCISCFMASFVEALDYTNDLQSLGGFYREYHALMEHWRTALPLPIHELRYEDLVADTEAEARKLIDFIGLEWDPACLEFHKQDRPVYTNSRVQVRQPVYSSSVQRWRRYERHLGPLRQALGDLADPA